MTTTSTPFGFIPLRMRGGTPNSTAENRYRINPAGNTNNIFRGDPVTLGTDGYISQSSVTSDYVLGVFWGCVYNDPTSKRPTWSNYYPANTSVGSDPFGIQAQVIDNWDATFKIQADNSVSVGLVGQNFAVSNAGGNVTFGRSGFVLKASSAGAASQLTRLVDVYESPDNAFGDAFTVVEVQWVQHRNLRVSAS